MKKQIMIDVELKSTASNSMYIAEIKVNDEVILRKRVDAATETEAEELFEVISNQMKIKIMSTLSQ